MQCPGFSTEDVDPQRVIQNSIIMRSQTAGSLRLTRASEPPVSTHVLAGFLLLNDHRVSSAAPVCIMAVQGLLAVWANCSPVLSTESEELTFFLQFH